MLKIRPSRLSALMDFIRNGKSAVNISRIIRYERTAVGFRRIRLTRGWKYDVRTVSVKPAADENRTVMKWDVSESAEDYDFDCPSKPIKRRPVLTCARLVDVVDDIFNNGTRAEWDAIFPRRFVRPVVVKRRNKRTIGSFKASGGMKVLSCVKTRTTEKDCLYVVVVRDGFKTTTVMDPDEALDLSTRAGVAEQVSPVDLTNKSGVVEQASPVDLTKKNDVNVRPLEDAPKKKKKTRRGGKKTKKSEPAEGNSAPVTEVESAKDVETVAEPVVPIVEPVVVDESSVPKKKKTRRGGKKNKKTDTDVKTVDLAVEKSVTDSAPESVSETSAPLLPADEEETFYQLKCFAMRAAVVLRASSHITRTSVLPDEISARKQKERSGIPERSGRRLDTVVNVYEAPAVLETSLPEQEDVLTVETSNLPDASRSEDCTDGFYQLKRFAMQVAVVERTSAHITKTSASIRKQKEKSCTSDVAVCTPVLRAFKNPEETFEVKVISPVIRDVLCETEVDEVVSQTAGTEESVCAAVADVVADIVETIAAEITEEVSGVPQTTLAVGKTDEIDTPVPVACACKRGPITGLPCECGTEALCDECREFCYVGVKCIVCLELEEQKRDKRQYKMRDVKGDGDCFYHSIVELGIEKNVHILKEKLRKNYGFMDKADVYKKLFGSTRSFWKTTTDPDHLPAYQMAAVVSHLYNMPIKCFLTGCGNDYVCAFGSSDATKTCYLTLDCGPDGVGHYSPVFYFTNRKVRGSPVIADVRKAGGMSRSAVPNSMKGYMFRKSHGQEVKHDIVSIQRRKETIDRAARTLAFSDLPEDDGYTVTAAKNTRGTRDIAAFSNLFSNVTVSSRDSASDESEDELVKPVVVTYKKDWDYAERMKLVAERNRIVDEKMRAEREEKQIDKPVFVPPVKKPNKKVKRRGPEHYKRQLAKRDEQYEIDYNKAKVDHRSRSQKFNAIMLSRENNQSKLVSLGSLAAPRFPARTPAPKDLSSEVGGGKLETAAAVIQKTNSIVSSANVIRSCAPEGVTGTIVESHANAMVGEKMKEMLEEIEIVPTFSRHAKTLGVSSRTDANDIAKLRSVVPSRTVVPCLPVDDRLNGKDYDSFAAALAQSIDSVCAQNLTTPCKFVGIDPRIVARLGVVNAHFCLGGSEVDVDMLKENLSAELCLAEERADDDAHTKILKKYNKELDFCVVSPTDCRVRSAYVFMRDLGIVSSEDDLAQMIINANAKRLSVVLRYSVNMLRYKSGKCSFTGVDWVRRGQTLNFDVGTLKNCVSYDFNVFINMTCGTNYKSTYAVGGKSLTFAFNYVDCSEIDYIVCDIVNSKHSDLDPVRVERPIAISSADRDSVRIICSLTDIRNIDHTTVYSCVIPRHIKSAIERSLIKQKNAAASDFAQVRSVVTQNLYVASLDGSFWREKTHDYDSRMITMLSVYFMQSLFEENYVGSQSASAHRIDAKGASSSFLKRVFYCAPRDVIRFIRGLGKDHKMLSADIRDSLGPYERDVRDEVAKFFVTDHKDYETLCDIVLGKTVGKIKGSLRFAVNRIIASYKVTKYGRRSQIALTDDIFKHNNVLCCVDQSEYVYNRVVIERSDIVIDEDDVPENVETEVITNVISFKCACGEDDASLMCDVTSHLGENDYVCDKCRKICCDSEEPSKCLACVDAVVDTVENKRALLVKADGDCLFHSFVRYGAAGSVVELLNVINENYSALISNCIADPDYASRGMGKVTGDLVAYSGAAGTRTSYSDRQILPSIRSVQMIAVCFNLCVKVFCSIGKATHSYVYGNRENEEVWLLYSRERGIGHFSPLVPSFDPAVDDQRFSYMKTKLAKVINGYKLPVTVDYGVLAGSAAELNLVHSPNGKLKVREYPVAKYEENMLVMCNDEKEFVNAARKYKSVVLHSYGDAGTGLFTFIGAELAKNDHCLAEFWLVDREVNYASFGVAEKCVRLSYDDVVLSLESTGELYGFSVDGPADETEQGSFDLRGKPMDDVRAAIAACPGGSFVVAESTLVEFTDMFPEAEFVVGSVEEGVLDKVLKKTTPLTDASAPFREVCKRMTDKLNITKDVIKTEVVILPEKELCVLFKTAVAAFGYSVTYEAVEIGECNVHRARMTTPDGFESDGFVSLVSGYYCETETYEVVEDGEKKKYNELFCYRDVNVTACADDVMFDTVTGLLHCFDYAGGCVKIKTMSGVVYSIACFELRNYRRRSIEDLTKFYVKTRQTWKKAKKVVYKPVVGTTRRTVLCNKMNSVSLKVVEKTRRSTKMGQLNHKSVTPYDSAGVSTATQYVLDETPNACESEKLITAESYETIVEHKDENIRTVPGSATDEVVKFVRGETSEVPQVLIDNDVVAVASGLSSDEEYVTADEAIDLPTVNLEDIGSKSAVCDVAGFPVEVTNIGTPECSHRSVSINVSADAIERARSTKSLDSESGCALIDCYAEYNMKMLDETVQALKCHAREILVKDRLKSKKVSTSVMEYVKAHHLGIARYQVAEVSERKTVHFTPVAGALVYDHRSLGCVSLDGSKDDAQFFTGDQLFGEGTILFSEQSTLFLYPQELKGLQRAKAENFDFSKSNAGYIQVGAGGGKSHNIVHSHKPYLRLTDNGLEIDDTCDVVITSTSANADDLASRIIEHYIGNISHDVYKCVLESDAFRKLPTDLELKDVASHLHAAVRTKSVRTSGSVLINDRITRAQREYYKLGDNILWIDECMMNHVGMSVACIALLNSPTTVMFGDVGQITFVDRTISKSFSRNSSVPDFFKCILNRKYTFRNPKDIAYVVNEELSKILESYGTKIPDPFISRSKIVRSVEHVTCKNIAGFAFKGDTAVLTLTHAEKMEIVRDLKDSKKFRVVTNSAGKTVMKSVAASFAVTVAVVGSIQGMEWDRVVACNYSAKPVLRWEDLNQSITLITRTRKSFTFVTKVSLGDNNIKSYPITKFVKKLEKTTDSAILAHSPDVEGFVDPVIVPNFDHYGGGYIPRPGGHIPKLEGPDYVLGQKRYLGINNVTSKGDADYSVNPKDVRNEAGYLSPSKLGKLLSEYAGKVVDLTAVTVMKGCDVCTLGHVLRGARLRKCIIRNGRYLIKSELAEFARVQNLSYECDLDVFEDEYHASVVKNDVVFVLFNGMMNSACQLFSEYKRGVKHTVDGFSFYIIDVSTRQSHQRAFTRSIMAAAACMGTSCHVEIVTSMTGTVFSTYRDGYYNNALTEVFPDATFSKKLKKVQYGDEEFTPNDCETVVDLCIPGAAGKELKTMTEMFNIEQHNITTSGPITMKTSADNYMVKPSKGYDPVAVLPMQVPRPRTTQELIVAIEKRNKAADFAIVDTNQFNTASEMFVTFMTKVIDTKKLLKIDRKRLLNDVTVGMLCEWADKQTPDVIRELGDVDQPIEETQLDRYSIDIKVNPKPVLSSSCFNEYARLQTIVYQTKDKNAIFAPIWKKMFRCIISCLNDKILINTDRPFESVVADMNVLFPPALIPSDYVKTEIDISKFDKSQHQAVLLFELELLRFFGLPEHMIAYWKKMHEFTTAINRTLGVKTSDPYQRKSGDAATFAGNTLFLLTTILRQLDMKDIFMVLAAGDDSCIVHKSYDFDANELGVRYGVEAKILHPEHFYFCSKHLLVVDNEWVFYSDPVKICMKLGRHDLRDKEHVEEWRLSLIEHTQAYALKSHGLDVLNLAVMERFRDLNTDITWYMRRLGSVCHIENFSKFYTPRVDDELVYVKRH